MSKINKPNNVKEYKAICLDINMIRYTISNNNNLSDLEINTLYKIEDELLNKLDIIWKKCSFLEKIKIELFIAHLLIDD